MSTKPRLMSIDTIDDNKYADFPVCDLSIHPRMYAVLRLLSSAYICIPAHYLFYTQAYYYHGNGFIMTVRPFTRTLTRRITSAPLKHRLHIQCMNNAWRKRFDTNWWIADCNCDENKYVWCTTGRIGVEMRVENVEYTFFRESERPSFLAYNEMGVLVDLLQTLLKDGIQQLENLAAVQQVMVE